MSRFLDTTGNSTLGIGVCARCNSKRALHQLMSDPNASGLKVCRDRGEGCMDNYDPYRLPARSPDKMTLPFYRPDVPLINEEGDIDWLRDDSVFVLVTTEGGTFMTTEGDTQLVIGSGNNSG